MISWIQNNIIRHGRWIFLTLLFVIIVAFVFTIGNTPGCTSNRSNYQAQNFYGIDLNSRAAVEPIAQKVRLSANLDGRNIRNEQQFQNALINRVGLLSLADDLNIPRPTQKTLAEFIKTKTAFQGPDGEFSPDLYTSFVDRIEMEGQIPEGLPIVVLEEDYRLGQLSKILSGPGYHLPAEVLSQAKRNRTSIGLSTAKVDFSEFEPSIEPSDDDLKAYYEENKERYEIPQRIEARYVFFPTSAFSIEAASEDTLQEYFEDNRARFVSEYKTQQAANSDDESQSTEETVTFELVKDAVAADFAKSEQKRVTNKAAQEFALGLYLNAVEKDSEAFDSAVAAQNGVIRELEPYSQRDVFQNELPKDFLEAGLNLPPNRYYTDAYSVEDGFAVLIRDGMIEAQEPEFSSIRDELSQNYLTQEKRSLFNERGTELKAEIEAKLGSGVPFVEAAEELGLTTNTYEPFVIREAPNELDRVAIQEAQQLEQGSVSAMLTSVNDGLFVYVESKDIPEISLDDEELTQSKDFLKSFSAYTSGITYVSELIAAGMPEVEEEE